MLVNEPEQFTRITFVGDLTGSRPDHYGDPKKIRVPKSRLTVRVFGLKFGILPAFQDYSLSWQKSHAVCDHGAGNMKIWVDADACPVVAREILFRAADRTGVQLTLVANQPMNAPASKNINTLQVPGGFDVADDEIVKRLDAGDLVITSDIPLAAEVIAKGGHALSPRGEMHTRENIGAKLNMRDFMDTMRSSGVEMGGGPSVYGQRDKQEFANNLDRFLTKHADNR